MDYPAPPSAGSLPKTIGVASGYQLYIKVGEAYSNAQHTEAAPNPDLVTYWNNLSPSFNTVEAREIFQGGEEFAEKILTEMDFTVDIAGEEDDPQIAELLAAVFAAGDAGKASSALVSPKGAAWNGWYIVGDGTPAMDPRGFKKFSFSFTHIGKTTFTPAPTPPAA